MRRIAKVAGGALLLVLFGACGSQMIGTLMQDAGGMLMDSGTAHGQAPGCRWETQKLILSGTTVNQIPVGWEPFAALPFSNASDWILVRRCV